MDLDIAAPIEPDDPARRSRYLTAVLAAGLAQQRASTLGAITGLSWHSSDGAAQPMIACERAMPAAALTT